jgi:hypothetical protein
MTAIVILVALGMLLSIPFVRKVIFGLLMMASIGFLTMTPYMLLTLLIYGIVHIVHKYR